MPKPKGHRQEDMGISIRQTASTHVISDIHYFQQSIKIYPNIKVTAKLLYTVTDAKFDDGMLF